MNQREYNLTEGSVLRKILLFALPIFGANLLQAMYGTVDLMVVGLFTSPDSVSAVSTGSMTMQTITGIIAGLTMGCTILLGHNIGKRDSDAASRTVASSFCIFVIFGILLAFIIAITAGPIASVMNAPKEAFTQTVGYIRICGIGIICIVLFNALSGMFRGIGDSRTPLLLMLVACIGNIILDLIFVGIFKMAGNGAAIATVMAQGISVIFAVFHIKRHGFGFEVNPSMLKPHLYETVTVLKYGTPIAIQDLLVGISFMVILAILNTFGVTASAGVGIAEKLCSLMFIIPSGMNAAVSAFTAQNVGAGKPERGLQAMKCGMILSFAFGILMFVLSFFHGDLLCSLFTHDAKTILDAADYLKSYSVDCIIVGFNFCMIGYFNGNGKTSFVATQGIMSTFLVRIPVSYFMSKISGVTLFQIGFATPMATCFAILVNVIYLKFVWSKKQA